MAHWYEKSLTIQQAFDLLQAVPAEKRGYHLVAESDGGQIANVITGLNFEPLAAGGEIATFTAKDEGLMSTQAKDSRSALPWEFDKSSCCWVRRDSMTQEVIVHIHPEQRLVSGVRIITYEWSWGERKTPPKGRGGSDFQLGPITLDDAKRLVEGKAAEWGIVVLTEVPCNTRFEREEPL